VTPRIVGIMCVFDSIFYVSRSYGNFEIRGTAAKLTTARLGTKTCRIDGVTCCGGLHEQHLSTNANLVPGLILILEAKMRMMV
jgi:hypothetical protein